MGGMTTPASVNTATKAYRDLAKQAVWTLLGFGVPVGLATVMFILVTKAITVDEQRFHIPGHQVLYAAAIAPGLFQLAYVIPLWHSARRRGLRDVSRGLLAGAILVAVLNCIGVALLAYMLPSFD